MKFSIVATVALGLALLSTIAVGQDTPKGKGAAPPAPSAGPKLTDVKAKASYSLGAMMGRNLVNQLKSQGVEIDAEVLALGLKDAMVGAKSLLTDAEMQSAMMALQQQAMAKQAESAKGAGAKNKADGEVFLAANKAKPGIVTLPSGLQYKVIKDGAGPSPKATDKVSVHYRGTLLDGTEFDSSFKRGQPANFPVNGVIKGWTEALQQMKVGSKWQLFIPGELAYGLTPPNGSGIGPNSVLLFEVELLGIE
jgi:FKBP-type peptidyl-prolyl cis-trans isomerase